MGIAALLGWACVFGVAAIAAPIAGPTGIRAEASAGAEVASAADSGRETMGPSTRRTAIVLSEVHHQPPPDAAGRDLRFIELHNTNPFPEDLSGWAFTGDVDFTLPEGTILPGLGYLVVAPRPIDIQATYGLTNAIGGFNSRLGPGRGSILLRKRSGGIVLQTEFSTDPDWDAASQGGGPSRALIRPSLGEAHPQAWAASVFIGGSPGRAEPPPPSDLSGVQLNELLADPTATIGAFVEVRQRSPVAEDLSGIILARPGGAVEHVLPADSMASPAGFLVVNGPPAEALVAPEGGTLLLLSPDRTRVLDAIRYPGSRPDLSIGRVVNHASRWSTTEFPTPGAPNARAHRPDVVFSEIHFEPLSDDPNDEFLEIHNRSSQVVHLGGWRIDGGVTYPFPDSTFLEPGGFLAIARNVIRLREQHPDLAHGRVVGDFAGSLRNRGERLTLLRPISLAPSAGSTPQFRHFAPEDDLTYIASARDNRWAAGGGSSLERIDFDAPSDDDHLWRDSDESARTSWTSVESSGALTLTHPGVPSADQLQILLLGPGEALVDDVEVLVSGNNRVVNGGFEAGTNRWVFQGTHRTSRVDPGAGPDGSQALHVIASDRGDHVVNRIRTTLTGPIPANTIVKLRAKLRWLKGHPEILLRLRNGGLEAVGRLAPPITSGTPGAPNSHPATNAAPSITDLRHDPVLPAAHQSVRIFARVTDPHGVRHVQLLYRRDPSTTLTTVRMTDDGTGPDAFAADGLFTGTLPGQPTGSMIAFRVVAADSQGASAAAPLPAGTREREALIRFGESPPTGAFGSYRIWMTAATRDTWTRREKMSNEDLDITFVSGTDRVIHNAGAHYSGSSYTSPIYDSPTGALCGYDLSFPEDDRFLGANRATLDWPIRDDTNQREQLMFWFLEQYGLPNLHRRYVRLTVNGVRRGTLYDDVQQPDGDTVEQWYPDDDEGSLWKTDCWNEFDNSGNRIDPCVLNTLERFPSSGPKKMARYRWNWRPRAIQSSATDFTDLFALVDAANATADYVPTVEALVDVDHWMRTFAMNDLASYWDAFGNPNAKNSFLYKPRHGRWQIFCWDFDVGLGVFNDPPTAALFDVGDPTIARMYRTPAFVRRYWAALQEATDGWFRTGAGAPIDRLLDWKYAAFQAQGISLANPALIKGWIRQRRTYLLQQLATVRSDFALTSNGGADFSATNSVITLTGRAPVGVSTLLIQGRERTVQWTTVSNWSVRISLQPGLNELRVEGVDRFGRLVAGARDDVRVTYSGAAGPLPPLRINEWLAQNSGSLTNPVTGETDDWFELHNAGATALDLSGYSLTDRLGTPDRSVVPAGMLIPAGGFLLVWADGRPEASRPGSTLHADFQLSQNGETIGVFDPLGRLVNSVTFGAQQPNQSEGRWSDGAGPPFLRFLTPTPGRSNNTEPSSPDSFQITVTWSPADPTVRLTWPSFPGRRYQTEFTDALEPAHWEPLGPARMASDGEFTLAVSDPQPSGTQRFYRVTLLP
jgi:hypothetical protein